QPVLKRFPADLQGLAGQHLQEPYIALLGLLILLHVIPEHVCNQRGGGVQFPEESLDIQRLRTLPERSGLPHPGNHVAKYRDLVDDLGQIESLAEPGRKMTCDQMALSAAELAESGTGGRKLRKKTRHEILKLRFRQP